MSSKSEKYSLDINKLLHLIQYLHLPILDLTRLHRNNLIEFVIH